MNLWYSENTKVREVHSRFEIQNTKFKIRDSISKSTIQPISKSTNQIKDLKICTLATFNCAK